MVLFKAKITIIRFHTGGSEGFLIHFINIKRKKICIKL